MFGGNVYMTIQSSLPSGVSAPADLQIESAKIERFCRRFRAERIIMLEIDLRVPICFEKEDMRTA